MLGRLCVCPLVPQPPIGIRTRLLVVMHRAEDRKSTNTGRLAAACLANSTIVVRGHKEEASAPLALDSETQPLLLFPFEDAAPLADVSRALERKPVTLIVPDGTWRQASKVRKRVPGLSDVPCVSVSGDARLPMRLRAEAHAHGLSTIEAVARAMAILEGDHVRVALERVFRAMVERTLWTRGDIQRSEVLDGIPEGALRHDWRVNP
jgi:DTW domain-containing protein YfiP